MFFCVHITLNIIKKIILAYAYFIHNFIDFSYFLKINAILICLKVKDMDILDK